MRRRDCALQFDDSQGACGIGDIGLGKTNVDIGENELGFSACSGGAEFLFHLLFEIAARFGLNERRRFSPVLTGDLINGMGGADGRLDGPLDPTVVIGTMLPSEMNPAFRC
ncbi:UNVERIFIED_CONTAM: hypothetical protein ABID98_003454 [Brevibacillus sp. OAP136]